MEPSNEFIKGFEIDRDKLRTMFGADKVDITIRSMIKRLDRSAYVYIATGYEPHKKVTHPLIIVLDVDTDEEKLKARPLGSIDPAIDWMKVALNGPNVWRKW